MENIRKSWCVKSPESNPKHHFWINVSKVKIAGFFLLSVVISPIQVCAVCHQTGCSYEVRQQSIVNFATQRLTTQVRFKI